MKITIESTEKMTFLNGTQARVWKGVSERGVSCLVFVSNVGVEKSADHSEFERELKETMPPTTVLMALNEVLSG